ncbi:uncharacterized protein ACLA_060020 [Aspergillus clavatus NRRL 1]|uniref:DUF7605 domain-containing protein n=1 Tax=Aspergillus clavatus (strain ATCC 1007 / CBS 513.65 / DSM 816 / NCTC 3887 / NRRL 1 / QM 1276 / 107) TaxID=344612 RepID=A1C4J5_ASPCL|nr:uncharacterized protein ACLA_060020 [Aspergillus clavatus NRRL 1]EAW15335.1 conserved hypothetical protein [Aspergillus clavatus NRRL 1]
MANPPQSGDGAACTTVVTEFRSVTEEHPENYTIEVDFMDKGEIRGLIQELLSNVRQYYTDAYREVMERQEQEEIKTVANRAWETLLSLFPNQPTLDIDFLSSEGENAAASIMKTLEEWAIAGLDHRPGGRDSLHYSVVAGHADKCMAHLDSFMSDAGDGDRPALWPFVKLIRVYLRSPILRTGLVLADLPGFRDLNFARLRATERYLRHSCDEVFIDVDAKETARTSSEVDAKHISNLDDQIQKLERRIANARARRRRFADSKRRNLAADEIIDLEYVDRFEDQSLKYMLTQDIHSERKEALILELKQFLISRRNKSVTEALMSSYTAKVFCVSNKLYSEYCSLDSDQADGYLQLSGIKELRRYCQLVPADAQFRATKSYLQNQVPALLGSLKQWALAGSHVVDARRAEVLRGVLNEAEQVLQSVQHLLTSSDHGTVRHRRYWRDGAVAVSRDWANVSQSDPSGSRKTLDLTGFYQWHHMSYTAWCKHHGRYRSPRIGYRCWNEEILNPALPQLRASWDTMLLWLEEEKNGLNEEVFNTFQNVCNSINEHHETAPEALKNLLWNLKHRQRCIKDVIAHAMDELFHATARIILDTMGGHSSSYMVSVMLPVYYACNRQYGKGSDARRKEIMDRSIMSSDLFEDFVALLVDDFRDLRKATFARLGQRLRHEIHNITRDLRVSVTVEGERSEADQDLKYAAALKRKAELIQTALGEAQKIMLEVSSVATA